MGDAKTPVEGSMTVQAGHPYGRVKTLLAQARCVMLDGGIATQLPAELTGNGDDRLWGTRALLEAPDAVQAVHRGYVGAGCDVITTDTWGLASALAEGGPRLWASTEPVHWMDLAREGVRL